MRRPVISVMLGRDAPRCDEGRVCGRHELLKEGFGSRGVAADVELR